MSVSGLISNKVATIARNNKKDIDTLITDVGNIESFSLASTAKEMVDNNLVGYINVGSMVFKSNTNTPTTIEDYDLITPTPKMSPVKGILEEEASGYRNIVGVDQNGLFYVKLNDDDGNISNRLATTQDFESFTTIKDFGNEISCVRFLGNGDYIVAIKSGHTFQIDPFYPIEISNNEWGNYPDYASVNMILNAYFPDATDTDEDGLMDNWLSTGADSFTLGTGGQEFTTTAQYGAIHKTFSATPLHKYYALALVHSDGLASEGYFLATDGTQWLNSFHSGSGDYELLSLEMTVAAGVYSQELKITSAKAGGGTRLKVKGMVLVDVTAAYPSGGEPTLEEFKRNAWNGVIPKTGLWKYHKKDEQEWTNLMSEPFLPKRTDTDGNGLGDTLSWYEIRNTYIASDGQHFLPTAIYGGIQQAVATTEGHKYYVLAVVKGSYTGEYIGADKLVFQCVHGDTYGDADYHSGSGEFEILGYEFTAGAVGDTVLLKVFHNAVTVFKEIVVMGFVVVDVTADYPGGDEPTFEEFKARFEPLKLAESMYTDPGEGNSFAQVMPYWSFRLSPVPAWQLSVYDNHIVFGDYAPIVYDGQTAIHSYAKYVQYSDDYGNNFRKIFDADNAPSGFWDPAEARDGFHIHGTLFDQYWNRIWWWTGDRVGARLLVWSDDFGETWNKIETSTYINGGYVQIISGLAMPHCILFTHDSTYQGTQEMYRVIRHNKEDEPIIEAVYNLLTAEEETPSPFAPVDLGDKFVKVGDLYLIPFVHNIDHVRNTNYILGTYDGHNFFEVWRNKYESTTTTYQYYFNVYVNGNKVYIDSADQRSALGVSNYTLALIGDSFSNTKSEGFSSETSLLILSELYSVTSATYNSAQEVTSANIVYSDGVVGTISNLIYGESGLASAEFSYNDTAYSLTLTYDSNSNFILKEVNKI